MTGKEIVSTEPRKAYLREYEDVPVKENEIRVKVELPRQNTERSLLISGVKIHFWKIFLMKNIFFSERAKRQQRNHFLCAPEICGSVISQRWERK